ncbi:aromatic ring-opening dioxygenase [Penicillium sp. IBT 16267x]|nr:aromatic ring-opening dioxygenase [Penicillium sp. IBT 16267x]
MGSAAAICITHGGGPMPVLGDENHKDIIHNLKNNVPKVLQLGTPEAPRAIIVITAHWSTCRPTISSGKKHSLYYDYYGMPKQAYSLEYNAPGSPKVAEEVREAMTKEGLQPVLDDKRGWDHGVFIPFMLINPSADVPLVQISVLESEDPEAHIAMGRALASLRDANIAIVGSGFPSFHSLPMMRDIYREGLDASSFRFTMDDWNKNLMEAVAHETLAERAVALRNWRKLPHSYQMHPPQTAEHFLPLLVIAGAAGDDGRPGWYSDNFAGMQIFTYYWSDVKVTASDTSY